MNFIPIIKKQQQYNWNLVNFRSDFFRTVVLTFVASEFKILF